MSEVTVIAALEQSVQVVVAEPSVFQLSGATFEYVQSTPSATWTVNHNLGFRPNVSVKTAGGLEVLAEVLHNSTNQTTIYLDSPMAGIANFS